MFIFILYIYTHIGTTPSKMANILDLKKFIQENGPYDLIIDAANVAYYGQHTSLDINFFSNVKGVLSSEFLEGKRFLAVLHKKHERYDIPFIESLIKEKKLYQVPYGTNDDYYWIYATLLSGSKSQLLSNDKMRDHFFGMLAPKCFLKWRDRHQVYYGFSTNSLGANYSPVICPVPPYSAIFQETKKNICWHIPISATGGWEEEADDFDISKEIQWLCCKKST